MGSLSDFAENEMLDHLTGVGSFEPSALGFTIGTDASDGGFIEVPATNSYDRVTATTAWSTTASSRLITNDATLTFPTASGTWEAQSGVPDRWAIFDSATHGAGNLLAYGDITTPTAIGNNDTPSFAIGEVDISFNSHVSNVGWSDTFVHKILNHLFLQATYNAETLFVGFGITPLTDNDTITTAGEASGGGYARQEVGVFSGAVQFDAAANGATANSGAISFTVSGTWTTNLDVIFIANDVSASANTNLVMFGTVTQFSAVSGDTVEIVTGDLDITLA